MPLVPAVGDLYLLTYKQLGSPIIRTEVKVAGLGRVILDEADINYARQDPEAAAFYVRRARTLGADYHVVVSRVQKA